MQHIEILTLLSIAFFASLGHCVGMCGGIVLTLNTIYGISLESRMRNVLSVSFVQILYHSGKIITYCILGFIAGSLGHIISPNDEVKYVILLIVGVVLVIVGLSIAQCIPPAIHIKLPFSQKIGRFMRHFLHKKSAYHIFALGLCNGLLPCGIVYYFLFVAIASGSGLNGAIVMGLFGLAAMPSLFVLGLVSGLFAKRRVLFLRLSGVVMICFGCYEIYKANKFLRIVDFMQN